MVEYTLWDSDDAGQEHDGTERCPFSQFKGAVWPQAWAKLDVNTDHDRPSRIVVPTPTDSDDTESTEIITDGTVDADGTEIN